MTSGFQHARTTTYVFVLLCALFIPIPSTVFPFQERLADLLFGKILAGLYTAVSGRVLENPQVSSDTTSLYLLVLLLFLFAVLLALLSGLYKNNPRKEKAYTAIRLLLCYYLSWQLLRYGFDKVFKAQFYLPEPNILYTPLGQVSKDLLFWSAMGTSRWYSVFGGVAEITAAVLLLFQRTRIIGSLLSFGILLQVVAINFGFDISVKVYSLFLLFLSALLTAPQLHRLYRFLLLQETTSLKQEPFIVLTSRAAGISIKTFAIGLLFLDATAPYILSRHFNDDTVARPYLHGAYEVNRVEEDGKPLDLSLSPVKRFFIHRKGYLIFQDPQDSTQDYRLEISPEKNKLLLTGYDLHRSSIDYTYREQDSTLTLTYSRNNKQYLLQAKALDWKKLPALQDHFHWRSDAPF